MANEKSKALKVAGGVVAAGIVAGAGIGIYQLRQWTKAMDKSLEKGATDMGGVAPVPPELLTWKEVGRVKTGVGVGAVICFVARWNGGGGGGEEVAGNESGGGSGAGYRIER